MPRDKEEFLREMIEKYSRMYMKLAYDNGVPFDDAEDVVMEAFWLFYQSKYFGNLDEPDAKRMLACIVKRKSVDYYRKNSHYEKVSLEEGISEEDALRNEASQDPLEKIIKDEKYQAIRTCMEEMRKIWREPAIMYFLDGYGEPEIADSLEISGAACRSRISRAKKHLKKALSALFDKY